MSLKIIKPTMRIPYKLKQSEPIILRTACSAGINRSAVVRELIKQNVQNSIVYPQYGAVYGDYEYPSIRYYTLCKDSFYDIFGRNKQENIQQILFDELGYEKVGDNSVQTLKEEDRHKYTELINQYFWLVGIKNMNNIFVLINEDENIINLVTKRLKDIGEDVELVILNIPDIIYTPLHKDILPQSVEAYNEFIDLVKQYIVFI